MRKERARGDETLLSVTGDRGVILQEDVGRRDSSSEDKTSYWRVKPGDIVYNTMRMWQGISGISAHAGIVSPAYTVCKPTSVVHSAFLAYLLKHPSYIREFYRGSQGLVSDTWNLKYSTFAKINVLLPPLHEQRRIAQILDTLDNQITILHNIHKKLLLARDALCQRLLRPGLSLLEDIATSGLGNLYGKEFVDESRCKTWRVEPLDLHLLGIDAGKSPDLDDRPAGPGEWGVLKVSAIKQEKFVPSENKVAINPSHHVSEYEVRGGDLLMTRANTAELVGLACVVSQSPPGLMLSDKTLRLRVDPANTDPQFVALLLSVPQIRRQIVTHATGTSGSMKNISQQAIRGLVMPWPDASHQRNIVRSLAQMSALQECNLQQTKKLFSLKLGLMDDLLTGRVRIPAE